eukprot:gene28192-37095_t
MVYERTSKVSGVLLLAHGCQHSATDWWPHSQSCPQCIGLPVEREIVLEALRHDILPVALSSSNRAHKCWTGRDVPVASRLIAHIYTRYLHSDYSIPLYLLGASSGGSFVGMLAQSKSTKPKVSAICVQIMALNNYSSLPPSLFVLMTRDAATLRHVEKNAAHLKDFSILRVEEKPITPTFFYDHGQALSKEDSTAVHTALKKAALIGSDSFLTSDPRMSEWREVVKTALPHIVPAVDSLEPDLSPISELLNLARAQHEITDDYLHEVFEWFKNHGKGHRRRAVNRSARMRLDGL